MKRNLLINILLIATMLSTTLLSACVFSNPKGFDENFYDSHNVFEDTDHYISDPNLNNPYVEGETVEVGEDGIYENNEEPHDNNDKIEGTVPETPNRDLDILLKALVNSLSIRSTPNTNRAAVGTMKSGAMLPYVDIANENWYETIYKGKKAFLSKKYTELVTFEKSSKQIEKVIDEGKLLLGFPYVFGAQRYHWGPSKGIKNTDFVMGKFDCSSLTQYAYYHGAGIILDLTTRTQIYQGIPVNKQNIKRGDLMFFTNASRQYKTDNERVGHVAIYLGDNYILHTASDYATIEPLNNTRWRYYISSRRFLD